MRQKHIVHYQIIHCLHCEGTDLQKNGKSFEGTKRRYCKECRKYFRLEYRYNACKKEVKAQIIEMTLNSSGVWDKQRHGYIRVKKTSSKTNPYFLTKEKSDKLEELEVDMRFFLHICKKQRFH